MSIQLNTNANTINWDTLLGKLDAASKAAKTEGADGVTAGRRVVFPVPQPPLCVLLVPLCFPLLPN